MKHVANVACVLLAACVAVAIISPYGRASTDAVSVPDEYVEGEVRKIDRRNRQVWLGHGGIGHLGLPPMTTLFDVREGIVRDQVKTGDRVLFKAINDKRTLVVVQMRPAR